MDIKSRAVPASFLFRFLLDRPRAFSVGVMLAVLPLVSLVVLNWLVGTMDGKGPDRALLRKNGVEAEAVVVSRSLVKDITIENRNPVRLTYRYMAGEHEITDAIETMDGPAYDLNEGDAVSIVYGAGDSFIPAFSEVHFPLLKLAMVAGIFALMGAPFLLFALVGAMQTRSLYLKGEVVSATVDGYTQAYAIPLTLRRVTLAYTAVGEDSCAIKGDSIVVDDGSWKGKPRGAEISVLVLGERSCVLEPSLWAKVKEG